MKATSTQSILRKKHVLTNLQRKILKLSAEGKTVKEISSEMEMSEYKIVKFLYILLRKFQEIDTTEKAINTYKCA